MAHSDSIHFGPLFGGSDIVIHTDCNQNEESFTNFGDIYRLPDTLEKKEALTYLAGSSYFKVAELEVFAMI